MMQTFTEEQGNERRTFERIQADMEIRFMIGRMFYSGVVKNYSKKGMYIHTETCFPFESRFDVIIRMEKETLTVPVKVFRLELKGDVCDGVGVELFNQTQNYSEFLSTLHVTV